jgi:TP901-1 family phage major tail protein
MKKFDLQLFAEAVQGKSIIYLFRILSEAASENAVAMAFTTENERSKSKDADVTATKDGSIRTPGAAEIEISATAVLSKGDTFTEKLEAAMDNDELIEIWEVNLEAPSTEGKFKGTYYQGYLTEFTLTSSSEEHAEYECTFAINGSGAKGDVTVSAEQQEVAAYVFTDTQKTGA